MEDGFPKFIAILSCNLRVNKEGTVLVVIADSLISSSGGHGPLKAIIKALK